MSGVIDEDGIQWEHCNRCMDWVQAGFLFYEEPSEKYEFGRDLCEGCYRGNISEELAAEKVAAEMKRREEYHNSPEAIAFRERLRRGSWETKETSYGSVSQFVPAPEDRE